MPAREVTHVEIAAIWIDVALRETHAMSAECTRHPVEEGADITDHVQLSPDTIAIEGLVSNQPIEPPRSHMFGVTANSAEAYQLLRRDGDGPIDEYKPKGVFSVTIEGEPIAGMLGLVPGLGQLAAFGALAPPDQQIKRRLAMELPDEQRTNRAYAQQALRFSKDFDRVKTVATALRLALLSRKPVTLVTGLRVYEAVVLVDLQFMREGTTGDALRFGATGQVIRVAKSDVGIVGQPDPVNERGKPGVNNGNQTGKAAKAGDVSADQQRKASAIKQILERSRKFLGNP